MAMACAEQEEWEKKKSVAEERDAGKQPTGSAFAKVVALHAGALVTHTQTHDWNEFTAMPKR